MDSPPPPPPNPNPSPGGGAATNVYQIGGVPVEFPYKPYGSQLAFMGRVISTLDRARRHGHCHALLESPTGTGKSLSLLCSSLAWQQHLRNRPPLDPPPPPPDPLVHGGGFIPDPDPSRNLEQTPKSANVKPKKKSAVPTIYYASRTHSQITQVIRELRKTSYRVPMAILASRRHYCTNKYICMKEKVDEECKLLLKDTGSGCPEFKNAHKVKGHASLQKGGCHEVHDIEDLVRVGRAVKGCSYFAAQAMAAEAQIVFCPYSYVINPIVRRAMDIDIKGSIVILDEAHNIEDMSRESGSLDVEEEVLYTLQTELGQLCTGESIAAIYQPLYDMIQGIISWMSDQTNNLQKHEFEHYSSYWTGDKAMRELQQAGITQQCFPILQECATKAIKASSDAESDAICLSGISAITLEGLFSSLGYFFSDNGCHALDYQLALQRYVKRDGSNSASGWTYSLSLWCLNPAVVFKEIADLSLSVILTSGTLSPMSSFASELGVQFEACMEAPHVIDVDSQLWAAVISSGPGNCKLNASYRTADGYGFQDALGASLEEICKVVPGGALVFFPSYKLMEKLIARWSQTGQWSRLNAEKPIFVEPRGNMDDFEPVLKGYYDSILGKSKVARGKPKRGLKRLSQNLSTEESSQDTAKKGATFFAVCRGKVSEGIDFSDDNARVVVVVGIPFPNKNNIQIVLKKRYNDTFKSSKGLLSGSEWYCHQAFRALNQAAGRCIRHRFDYGAIILLDDRFKEERNVAYISKWLRKSIKQYDSFDESLQGLRAFFMDAQKRLGENCKSAQETQFIPETSKEKLSSLQQHFFDQLIPQKKNQIENNPNIHSTKMIPGNMSQPRGQLTNASPAGVKVQSDRKVRIRGQISNRKVRIGGKRSKELLNRCSDTSCLDPSINTLEQYLVNRETTSHCNSYPDVTETCKGLSDIPSSSPPTISNRDLAEDVCTSIGIPERLESSLCTFEHPLIVKNPTEDGGLYSEVVQISNSDTPSFSLPTTVSEGTLSGCPCTSAGTPERLGSRGNILRQSMIVNSTIEDGSLHSKLVKTCNQFSGRPSLFPSISEGKLSKSLFTSTGSPETVVTEFYNSELESSLSTSVNSHNQKKRKKMGLQPCCSMQTDCFSNLDSESFCGKFISTNTDPRTESIFSDDSLRCKLEKPMRLKFMENALPLSSDLLNEKKLHICCSLCKASLGMEKNNLLVTCSLASFSMVFMSYVLNHGPPSTCSPEDLSRTQRTNVSTVVSDVSTIHPRILNRCISEGPLQMSIWSEEDGCVFRAVACPFCIDSKACLGVQVLATDALNVQLINKILFYADNLDIRDEQTSNDKAVQPVSSNAVGSESGLVDIEKYAYNPGPEGSGFLSRMKSKLKLPKREQFSSQN